MALTSIVALVKPPLGSIYRKRTKKKNWGGRGKEQRAEPTVEAELFMLPTLREPMIRTAREKRGREAIVNSNL